MAKTYNREKHFDIDYFRTKGIAYFDTLDFSDVSNEEIRQIATSGFPEIEFYQCIFKDLDLSETRFISDIRFTECEFSGNTSFEKCIFQEEASFMRSVFNGVTNFDNVIYKKGLSFYRIRTKPAKDGYFYFRGEEIRVDKNYDHHNIDFRGAMFETEVSFLGNQFLGDSNFQDAVFKNKFWFTNVDFGLKTNIDVKFDCDGFKDIDMCYRILKDALMRKHYTLQSYAIERLEEKIRQKQRKDDDFEQKEPQHKQPSELLTTEEAAAYLKLKPNTLERWRSQYPHRLPFVKIGRTVKYRLEDLQAFISGNRQGS